MTLIRSVWFVFGIIKKPTLLNLTQPKMNRKILEKQASNDLVFRCLAACSVPLYRLNKAIAQHFHPRQKVNLNCLHSPLGNERSCAETCLTPFKDFDGVFLHNSSKLAFRTQITGRMTSILFFRDRVDLQLINIGTASAEIQDCTMGINDRFF